MPRQRVAGWVDLPPVHYDKPEECPTALRPDIYDCPICKNRSYRIWEDEQGNRKAVPCRCAPIRSGIMRLRKAGLAKAINDYTFEKYHTEGDRQRENILSAARQYAQKPSGWFFIGGGTGTGKTHICAAICRECILRGVDTRYVRWRDDAPEAKRAVNDSEAYRSLVQPWKDCRLLYIDDLFKTGKNGEDAQPTAADRNLAYEILNNRYMDPEKLTIISTEFSIREIMDIDSAIGGRIVEMSRGRMCTTSKMPDWRRTHARW